MPQQFSNRLINETSPYLLQHAHNPVDWYAWGDEALQKAKDQNKPILVSIGYSACHWCHVMEKESFENVEVAKVMNENFINIKIDREERPDLDAIYMDAVQAISGSGGWPLNVFLTPDKKPFYGGTYFPPVAAFNRSSWTDTLLGIANAWNERKHEIESQADNLIDYMLKTNDITGKRAAINPEIAQSTNPENCHIIFKNILNSADKVWGGFGKAPKFPQTFTIHYLLQYYHFTKNKESLDQALLSIDKMLQGGIYDHIAGGLARYSTDNEWLAPHFEKMLYDNALLVNILTDAFQITGDEKYRNAIIKTINFVELELMSEEGGFYAALDADSEGEEGKYYVWQKEEIDHILGKDADMFCAFFDVTESGNWEHKNILRTLLPLDEFVIKFNLDKIEFEETVQSCLKKLSEVRSKRVKPSLDDKIILSWNALMLHAICKASAALQDDAYMELAKRNFNFIISRFRQEAATPALYHTYKNGQAKYPAFLEDYAYLIQACIGLYEITFDEKYYTLAKQYCEYVIEHYSDEEKLFFYFTHADQKDIVVRKKEIYDGAMPSANAIMAKNLSMLSITNVTSEWKMRATQMCEYIRMMAVKYPTSFANWAMQLLHQTVGVNEIKIEGRRTRELARIFNKAYIPNKVLLQSTEENNATVSQAKSLSDHSTFIYLCKNNVCLEPVTDIQKALETIKKRDYLN
ncbi:thioredoxin domain-containing protein [Ferruginibacter sp. SUN002]|uniref:thioredoxin domain-containing protein n=1 Tax=Ferruginibacter sp. SUN002 TaxID=2937789 RepID=UPI003D368D03